MIAAVVLGGASITGGQGSIWGTVAGMLTISILANGMSIMNVEPFYQRIVTGLALLIAVGIDQYRKRRSGRQQSGGRAMRRRFAVSEVTTITQSFEEDVKRWCQTNANQSLFSQTRSVSGRAELTPLGESGGAAGLELVPAGEGALSVEVVVY